MLNHHVTAEISTKGRSHTTLPDVVLGIASQIIPPAKVLIFDDNLPHEDFRKIERLSHALQLCSDKGIFWRVLFGDGTGQVKNHLAALEQADTAWIWRLDDDNYPEPEVLAKLWGHVRENTGAVASAIRIPGAPGIDVKSAVFSPFIADSGTKLAVQLGKMDGLCFPEHLHNSFLFRREAGRKAGYQTNLSAVGHREETLFSFGIKKAGYELIVDGTLTTWHLKSAQGGIRSYQDAGLWGRDEQVFRERLASWDITLNQYRLIPLLVGKGDHVILRSVLPQILEANPNRRIIVAATWPEFFDGVAGIDVCGIGDAIWAFGNLDHLNVYNWCIQQNWGKSIGEAFVQMHTT